MKYRSRLIIEALQLRWDTWSEMCEFVSVGKLSNNEPEGCFGNYGQINLRIPAFMCINELSPYKQADENDYIIKNPKGYIQVLKPDVFERRYEKDIGNWCQK